MRIKLAKGKQEELILTSTAIMTLTVLNIRTTLIPTMQQTMHTMWYRVEVTKIHGENAVNVIL